MTSSHGEDNLACEPGGLAEDGNFEPVPYHGKPIAKNGADFKSQAEAQGLLRADPSDPNRFDRDQDGIVGEGNPAPYDRDAVPRF
ncbi:MAG: hypothetical protein V3U08_06450 [Nitrospirales bacterium]